MTADDSLQADLARLRAENTDLRERLASLELQMSIDARALGMLRPGKSGTLLARDVMTTDPHIAHPADTLGTLLERFREGGFRRVPVLDDDGKLVGIVTDRDLRRACNSPYVMHERWEDEMLLEQVQAEMCMTPDPVTIGPDTPVYEIARVMRMRKIGGLPVLDKDEKLVGIVTETDMLRAFERALYTASGDAG